MKKLSLCFALIFLSILVCAQRYTDMGIVLNSPKSGDSVGVTKQFNINASITNNGTDTFRVIDTAHFVLSFDGGAIGFGGGNGGFNPYLLLTNKELVPGQSTSVNFDFTLGDTWTLGASEICAKIVSLNTMDTVGSNDSSCANIIVRSSGVGVASINNISLRVNAYPNPSVGDIYFDIKSSKREEVVIVLYDVTGKIVASEKGILNQANSETITINRRQLVKGIYFYKVITTDGSAYGKVEIQ